MSSSIRRRAVLLLLVSFSLFLNCVVAFLRSPPPGLVPLLLLVPVSAAAATSAPPPPTSATSSSSSSESQLPTPTQQFIGELDEETGFYQSIRLAPGPPLLRKQSKYQLIEIHSSEHFGKVLVLDGIVQLTELDADAYNEMMAHLPMFQHPNPRRVLVIGGGDGYVLSEVLKHDSVVHVDHVDLDEDVVEACREHFAWGSAWGDPRVRLHIADGAAFVRNSPPNAYDVVIQDSSDPWAEGEDGQRIELPSAALYTKEHMSNIYRALDVDGVFNLQAETMQIPSDLAGAIRWRLDALKVGFQRARYGSIMIPSYPMGQIGCLLSEKKAVDGGSAGIEVNERIRLSVEERYKRMCDAGKETTYYHPRLQTSAFDLPLWAEKRIYGSQDPASALNCDADEEPTKTM